MSRKIRFDDNYVTIAHLIELLVLLDKEGALNIIDRNNVGGMDEKALDSLCEAKIKKAFEPFMSYEDTEPPCIYDGAGGDYTS